MSTCLIIHNVNTICTMFTHLTIHNVRTICSTHHNHLTPFTMPTCLAKYNVHSVHMFALTLHNVYIESAYFTICPANAHASNQPFQKLLGSIKQTQDASPLPPPLVGISLIIVLATSTSLPNTHYCSQTLQLEKMSESSYFSFGDS